MALEKNLETHIELLQISRYASVILPLAQFELT